MLSALLIVAVVVGAKTHYYSDCRYLGDLVIPRRNPASATEASEPKPPFRLPCSGSRGRDLLLVADNASVLTSIVFAVLWLLFFW